MKYIDQSRKLACRIEQYGCLCTYYEISHEDVMCKVNLPWPYKGCNPLPVSKHFFIFFVYAANRYRSALLPLEVSGKTPCKSHAENPSGPWRLQAVWSATVCPLYQCEQVLPIGLRGAPVSHCASSEGVRTRDSSLALYSRGPGVGCKS